MTDPKIAHLLAAASPAGLRLAKAKAMPDAWAMLNGMRVDGHDFTYEGRPFLKDIIRDHYHRRAIRKSAQMGATVISLTTAMFWWVEWNWNVMYLLPVKAGTIPFSQGRIQPMLDAMPRVKSRLKAVDNVNHKRTDLANFYVRGTNVVTELQEVPIDAMILDERDKMKEKNLPMADTRMNASKWKWVMALSTPTIPNFGIDREFQNSDQRYWYIRCPRCNHAQTLEWDENVKIGTSHRDTIVECQKCHKEWPHDKIIEASEGTGFWEAHEPGLADECHGYQINQLFSPTRPIHELARIYFRGLEDPEAMRELYNSALGLPYVVEGDRLTEDILDACRDGETALPGTQNLPTDERLYVGVDVGKVLHVSVDRMRWQHGKREPLARETMSWTELHQLLERIGDFVCVIDRFPETQKCLELAQRFWGKVFLCQYRRHGELADWTYPTDRTEVGEVRADRTLAIDYVNQQYMRRSVILPRNMRDVGERQQNRPYQGWYRQMMSQVRIQQPDRTGNMVATYEQVDGPDHWHHSDVYVMLATSFATPGVPPVAEQQAAVVTGDDLGLDQYEFGDFMIEPGFVDDFDLGVE